MTLSESQVEEVKRYLKKNKIENRLIFSDFLDHLCCMIEQNMSEGASFENSLNAALNYLSGSEIKTIELFTLKLLNMETIFSSRTSLLATIPFGLFGLAWAVSNSGLNIPAFIESFLLIVSVISMLILFCIGWINDFPRWSFFSIGFCLLVSSFFMMVRIPPFSNDLLGFWAWIPFLITLVICLMFKPSIGPLKKIVKRVKEEPALILFALYGFAPFFLFLLCDEIHSVWMLFVALLSTLILSSGIYFFLRSNKKKFRLFSIIISGLLAVILTFSASYIYWG